MFWSGVKNVPTPREQLPFFERNASLFFSVILYLELVIVEFERVHRFFDPAIFCFKFKVSFSVSWLGQYFGRKKNYLMS